MNISFEGKRVLVTGAGRGIGKEIASTLVACGAKVLAVDIIQENLEQLRNELSNVEIIKVDLSDWNATQEALKDIGHVDGLVNNAGICKTNLLINITQEEFDRTFAVNTKAVMNVSQIVVKEWLATKSSGAIVNISSQAAKAGLEKFSVYCASKGAVDTITKALAVELGPHNIRVNSVNPTLVKTEMGRLFLDNPDNVNYLIDTFIPLRRICEVQDVTSAVVFLLSDKASMVNGINLPVDGGYLAK